MGRKVGRPKGKGGKHDPNKRRCTGKVYSEKVVALQLKGLG